MAAGIHELIESPVMSWWRPKRPRFAANTPRIPSPVDATAPLPHLAPTIARHRAGD